MLGSRLTITSSNSPCSKLRDLRGFHGRTELNRQPRKGETMREQITKTDYFAAKCAECGHTLTNPGYHGNTRFCCGRYRRWYDTFEIVFERETGRDERGR